MAKTVTLLSVQTILVLISTMLLCTAFEKPFSDPELAGIVPEKSLQALQQPLSINTVYPCSVVVALSFYVDTYTVVLHSNGVDSVIAGGVPQSNLITFDFKTPAVQACTLLVVIVRETGTTDTLVQPVTIKADPPQVSVDSTRYHLAFHQSMQLKAYVADADNNLSRYSMEITPPDTLIEDFFKTNRRSKDTLVFTVNAKSPAEIVYRVQVTDDFNFSASAACTVTVFEASIPSITLLGPDTTKDYTADSLPIHFRALIDDESGVSTALLTYGSQTPKIREMAIAGDTVAFDVSDIDSGKNLCSIRVKDLFNNSDTLFFNVNYIGVKKIPPRIDSLPPIVVKEGHAFDTLFLDTMVTIADPGATYGPTDLVWSFATAPGAVLAPVYLPTKRKLFVSLAVADSEWNDSQKITFSVQAPGGLSDSRPMTFAITPVNDTPRITAKSMGATDTIYLDTCAADPDNKGRDLKWSFGVGKIVKVIAVTTSRTFPGKTLLDWNATRRIVAVQLDATVNYKSFADPIICIATDPLGLADTTSVIFKKGLIIHIPFIEEITR
jgi:hypothetical protein